MATGHEPYLERSGERYREAHEAVEAMLEDRFPVFDRVFENGMPMWRIPRPDGAPMPEREGTIDAAYVHIGLVERKAGLTLHLWYPPEYDLIDRFAEELVAAGLKPMQGCVQFNRMGAFPATAIEPLLDHIHNADGF